MAYLNITLGGLSVSIEEDVLYPDALDDLSARVQTLFDNSITRAEASGIDVMDFQMTPYLDDEEED